MASFPVAGWGAAYCRGGEYGVDKQTPEMKLAYQDTYRNTNIVEGIYGSLKFYAGLFDNIHPSNASAVVCSQRDHIFPRLAPAHQHGKRRKADADASAGTLKRHRKLEHTDGRIDEFSPAVKSSMVTAMRTGRRDYEQAARDDHAAALAAHRARDAASVKEGLNRLVRMYLKAKKAFDAAPIVSDADIVGRTLIRTLEARLVANLTAQRSDNVRARVLKENIERFVNGMGLSQFDPKFYSSSDPSSEKGDAGSEKNVIFLKATLVGIYDSIKKEKIELPTSVVVPEMQTRSLPTIGEPTLQRVKLQKGEKVDVQELDRLAAERVVAPRARCDTSARPTKMPELNNELVGKRIEAAWDLTYNLAGGRQATGLFWCPGVIEALSDETTRVDNKKVGMGWIFIVYDDGDKGWSLASDRWRWDSSKAGCFRFEGTDDDDDDEEDDEFADAVDADDDGDDAFDDEE